MVRSEWSSGPASRGAGSIVSMPTVPACDQRLAAHGAHAEVGGKLRGDAVVVLGVLDLDRPGLEQHRDGRGHVRERDALPLRRDLSSRGRSRAVHGQGRDSLTRGVVEPRDHAVCLDRLPDRRAQTLDPFDGLLPCSSSLVHRSARHGLPPNAASILSTH